MANNEPQVTDSLVDDVVEATEAAPITVLRRLVGLPVRGRVAGRIDRELAARGLKSGGSVPPAPAQPSA